MPASNMENNNKREDLEKIFKKIQDHLKHVSPVNVDHSSYRNQGGHPMAHCAYDDQENRQVREDKQMDINTD